MTGSSLARPEPAGLVQSKLLGGLSEQFGLAPADMLQTVKSMCGCQGASDAHFAGLMMTAKSLGLNPVMRELWLMPLQKGPTVVISADGYYRFLQRALADGTLTRHEYSDEWRLDPNFPPKLAEKDGKFKRCGVVTLWRKGDERPRVYVEWLDEVRRKTQPWDQNTARMLKHKSYSQALRVELGIYVPDPDEAGPTDVPIPTEAEVRDVAPIVSIQSVTAPPPAEPVIVDAPAAAPDPNLSERAVAAIAKISEASGEQFEKAEYRVVDCRSALDSDNAPYTEYEVTAMEAAILRRRSELGLGA